MQSSVVAAFGSALQQALSARLLSLLSLLLFRQLGECEWGGMSHSAGKVSACLVAGYWRDWNETVGDPSEIADSGKYLSVKALASD